MSAPPLRVALAGLGTVGVGLLRLLAANGQRVAGRAGRAVQVTHVAARDRSRDRGVPLDACVWWDDPVAMARDAEADVVVELIGGSDGAALATVRAALAAGRPVVTANKALLAHHGMDLASAAEAAGVALAYEGAVAGGIPVVKALRESLAGNRINRVVAILNGTSNYILTHMRQSGRDFAEVLADAQRLGYAEADPAFDVDGVDAAHKLALLASLAFGSRVDFPAIHVEGIRHITPLDHAYAAELGYRIKLLGIARRERGAIEQRVHPCLVSLDEPIAHIEGVLNSVLLDGDPVGPVELEGRGAGAGPTASAVAGDLVDIARGNAGPAFGLPVADLAALPTLAMAQREGAVYIRLMVRDQPGVIAEVATILRDARVSLEALVQRARAPDSTVPVVMTTHSAPEGAVRQALDRIARLDAVVAPPAAIRIENLSPDA
ncbi:MAG: homoserine dehydrogenase [Alphaproteobacteria bacterium]